MPDLENFSKEFERAVNLIKEAETYVEYELSEAYSTLAELTVVLLDELLEGKDIDFKSEFAEPIYLAWTTALNDNIEEAEKLADKLEKILIDTTDLRNKLEEAKISLKRAENLFYQGDYERAIQYLRDHTKKIFRIKKKWIANIPNKIRESIWRIFTGIAIIWAATISQYSKIGSLNKLILILVIEFIFVFIILLLIISIFKRR